MPGRILWGSIVSALAGALAVSLSAHAPAHSSSQTAVAIPATTSQPHQDPQALAGIWTFNKDLSSDTSKIQTQAASAQSGGDTGTRRRGFGGMGRGGGGARPQPNNTQALQIRALLREMADQPARETIVITPDTTTLTDDTGAVRKFTTNGKKETIDLEATQVDSVSKWDGSVLTVELSAGSFTLTETYQVTVQGHELVVALSAANSSRQGGAQTPAPVKRIYDKADAGG